MGNQSNNERQNVSSETQYTSEKVENAIRTLSNSEAGRQALKELYPFFDGSAAGLDSFNRGACCTLINAFWGGLPGTVLEELRRAGAD